MARVNAGRSDIKKTRQPNENAESAASATSADSAAGEAAADPGRPLGTTIGWCHRAAAEEWRHMALGSVGPGSGQHSPKIASMTLR